MDQQIALSDKDKSKEELVRELSEMRTRQEKDRAALRESETRFRNLYERAPLSYQSLDAQGHFLDVNQTWLDTLGYARQEVIGKSFDAFLHPDWRDHFKKTFPRLKALGEILGVEFEMVKKDGSMILVSLIGNIAEDPVGKFQQTHCIFQDITERRKAEKKLRESEKRFRSLVESLGEGIILQDASERILLCNKTAAELFDIDMDAFHTSIHRDWKTIREDGSPYPAKDHPSLHTLQTGEPCSGVIMGIEHDDQETTWIKINTRPLFQKDASEPYAVVISFSNVTERKQAELALQELTANLEQRVNERTRTAEVRTQQLQILTVELIEAEERERRRVAELLHDDLQQIIAGAKFHLQTLCGAPALEPALSEVESLLEESIRKMRLLSYDLGPPVLYHAGLVASMQWLAKQIEVQYGLRVTLETNAEQTFESAPLKVFIFRAVQELLLNTVKHAGVQSANIFLSGSDNQLVITVSDRGRGFHPEILNAATTPGGIGLLSIRERARHMGGDLVIESTPGQGSRSTLKVPLTLSRVYEVQQYTQEAEHQLYTVVDRVDGDTVAGTRVLFVDDHKVMRQGLIKLVSGNPAIQVVGEAANGLEAIERSLQLKPDLIVMDISMPEMDGIEATRRIKAEQPNVRIVGLSMHEDAHLAHRMRQAGAEALLSKTTSTAELLKAIYGISSR